MGIHQVPVPGYWSYYLVLEGDVASLSRWVHFDQKNFDVFSIEIARLLMTTCAEVDVVAKAICKQIDATASAENIGKYEAVFLRLLPDIRQARVHMTAFGLELQPWSNWSGAKPTTPLWWTANNKIKHHRGQSFEKANLKNLLNAVAGLVVLLVLYYQTVEKQTHLVPMPAHFQPLTFAMPEGHVGPQSALRLWIPDGNPLVQALQ